MRLTTERLELILQSTAELLESIEALPPADRSQVSPEWLERVRRSTTADPWTHGFAIRQLGSGAAIGSCGFKGPPDADGTVEIAYGIDPAFQGQGYATEAARCLVELALASQHVRRIWAHTLAETGASARVLTKCGFAPIGQVLDPVDGLVWRWEWQARQD